MGHLPLCAAVAGGSDPHGVPTVGWQHSSCPRCTGLLGHCCSCCWGSRRNDQFSHIWRGGSSRAQVHTREHTPYRATMTQHAVIQLREMDSTHTSHSAGMCSSLLAERHIFHAAAIQHTSTACGPWAQLLTVFPCVFVCVLRRLSWQAKLPVVWSWPHCAASANWRCRQQSKGYSTAQASTAQQQRCCCCCALASWHGYCQECSKRWLSCGNTQVISHTADSD